MINVTFTQEGEKLSLRLEGHAGYAEHGKDIICASASILAFTVAQFVKEAEYNGDLVTPAEVELEGGEAFISCKPAEDTFPTIQNIYLFAKMGYAILEHNYPQYVSLNDLT